MAKIKKHQGLIIPGDAPPTVASLKRQLLFFDSIAIADPQDKALVNSSEISERFPGMHITWADYARYPLIEGYDEEYEYVLRDTKSLVNRGLLRILPSRERSVDDAGANFVLYNSAISVQGLVFEAIPDRNNGKPLVSIPDGMISGGGLSKSGHRSKYELRVNNPCKLNGVPAEWETLAYLRLGRVLKYMRRANASGYFPVATDLVSHKLCSALSSSSGYVDQVHLANCEDLATYSISLDVVDVCELENALNDMSWADVLKVRREILPKVAEFREYIFSNYNILSVHDLTQDEVSKIVAKSRSEFERCQDELASAWEKLRIASVLKGGGITGSGAVGMSLVPSVTGTWDEILIRVVGAGLAAAAALTSEVQALIPAHRKLKNHPLFFSTMLPKKLTSA